MSLFLTPCCAVVMVPFCTAPCCAVQVGSGLWMNEASVGDAGTSCLGYFGGTFSPDGASIVAHGFTGACVDGRVGGVGGTGTVWGRWCGGSCDWAGAGLEGT